jgi:hypothetical protein
VRFWITLCAYEGVWFAAVIGAGRGHVWPGVAAAASFAAWRLSSSQHPGIELRLIAVALLVGALLESTWVSCGLIRYSAAWPWRALPAWLMALWVAFALTILPLFGYLRARPWLAATLGAIGGPLAYLGAARGWHAVRLPTPAWPTLLALALGWGIALPLLTSLARRWLYQEPQGSPL